MMLLNEALSSAVARCYPDFPVGEANGFYPMLDLARGDFSSNIAIDIASRTRIQTAAIAERLFESLATDVPEQWRHEGGYIVVSGGAHQWWNAEVARARDAANLVIPSSAPRAFVALVPDRTLPVYARLRIIALTGMHCWLAVSHGRECRVLFDPCAPRSVRTPGELLAAVREATFRVMDSAGEERLRISDDVRALADGSESAVFVWTAHHYADRIEEGSRRWLDSVRTSERITLRMPPDGWLVSRERVLPELLSPDALSALLKPLSQATPSGNAYLLRWMFQAASSVLSGDFDPAVFRFDECASVLWNLRALSERFRRFVPAPALSQKSAPSVEPLVPKMRGAWLRSNFLGAWIRLALRQGDVLALMEVLQEFAMRGHSLLNDPGIRCEIHESSLSDVTRQILASVDFGLSSILPIVAEEPCTDR